MDSTIKIFSGRATLPLARKIAEDYGVPLGNIIIFNFSDGEFIPSFEETVRGSKGIHHPVYTASVRQPHGVVVDD